MELLTQLRGLCLHCLQRYFWQSRPYTTWDLSRGSCVFVNLVASPHVGLANIYQRLSAPHSNAYLKTCLTTRNEEPLHWIARAPTFSFGQPVRQSFLTSKPQLRSPEDVHPPLLVGYLGTTGTEWHRVALRRHLPDIQTLEKDKSNKQTMNHCKTPTRSKRWSPLRELFVPWREAARISDASFAAF